MEFSFVEVNEAVSAAIPDREAVVFRDRRLTYAQLAEPPRDGPPRPPVLR